MRWPDSSAGKHATRKPPRIWSLPTCSLIQCGAVRRPGPAFGSTYSMFRSSCDRNRNRSTRTLSGSEDAIELVRFGHLELIVAAVSRLFVRPPAQERGGVTET